MAEQRSLEPSRLPSGRRKLQALLVMAAWVVASFAVYISNASDLSSGDTVSSALIPIALILDGTVMLDRFAEEERARFSKTPYWLVETPRGIASRYPVMTG